MSGPTEVEAELAELAARWGIHAVLYCDMGNGSGRIFKAGSEWVALISPRVPPPFRIAILMHEIGHLVLGHLEKVFDPAKYPEQEKAANDWAVQQLADRFDPGLLREFFAR